MYIIYVLRSLRVDRYYVGCSKNINRRLIEHNSGKVRSTKAYIPWKIVYMEKFENKSQAFRREKEIKSYKSGIKFKKLIK